MYRFLSTLPNVILVRGNHEDLLVDMVERGYAKSHDFDNKTVKTANEICYHYFPNNEKN